MRDEFDARLWNDHHQPFGEAVAEVAANLRRHLRFRVPLRLVSAAAALALSSVTVLSAVGPVEGAIPTAPSA